jgi:hypothetical protein
VYARACVRRACAFRVRVHVNASNQGWLRAGPIFRFDKDDLPQPSNIRYQAARSRFKLAIGTELCALDPFCTLNRGGVPT